jgi:dienelactone hydrolase
LYKAPKVEWAGDRAGLVRPLYYAGEPYGGKPTRVFAYYAAPKSAEKTLPGMVLVHGGGGKAFREWAELWAKRGYAAIAMDLAGKGLDGQCLPDGGPNQSHVEKFEHIARGLKEAWPYHAVANVIRAHSLLRSLPEVDAAHTGITGISWGGYLTCIVAGVDDRFNVAVPVYGCGFLHENSAWLNVFAKMPPGDRKLWIDHYDPSRYLPGCGAPMLFVNGTNDFAYPLDSYQKSYRLVQGPRTLCVTVRMPHGHPAGWRPKEIGLFVDSVLRRGKPLARFGKDTCQGREVVAGFTSAMPITEAALHYTTDGGVWKDRIWQTLPARTEDGKVAATLPTDKGIVYFLTIKDKRGAIVSTEHRELKP